jgi:hypothetical protein
MEKVNTDYKKKGAVNKKAALESVS